MIIPKYIISNLGRKKKQTIFSLLCISVSSFIILADFAMINGMQEKLKEAINRVLSGQITVYSSDDAQLNILEAQLKEQRAFTWADADTRQLKTEFPGIQVNQRIRAGSLISYEEQTSYVNLHALEEDHLRKVNTMLTFLNGRMAGNGNEIVISESMAEELHCTVGDTVLLVANNIYDYMTDAIGVVSGVFEEKGLAIFLSYNGFMPFEAGKALAEVMSEESIELVINPAAERDFSADEIAHFSNWFNTHHPELKLTTWDKTAPLLYSIVRVWQGGGLITQVMFMLFSLIILITLTSLVVRSRKKEFGTLRAIGFSWNRIKLLVCTEYALLCLLSVLMGYGLLEVLLLMTDASGIAIQSEDMQSALMTDRLLPFLYPKDLLYVFIIFLITTLASALISVARLQKKKITSLINE